jgi:GT2 family glycosyltransferase
MKLPPVTIVIPVFKHGATLGACVRAVLAQTDYPDWQVIVVDDGAGPEMTANLPKARQLRIIRQPNGGVARALNAGFAAAAGRDVVRLHADVVIETPGWLSLLAEAAYAQPRTAAVGARLIYPDGRIQSEGRSIIGAFGFHVRHCDRKAFQPESTAGQRAEVDSVAGGLAYYCRSALDEIGGLDEGYGPAWFEDDDFCFAARRLNYKIWVEPAVRAVHYTRSAPPTFAQGKGATEKMVMQLVRGFKQTAFKLQAERWQAKWGWHPFYPDLNEIRRLYGATEICWQIGEQLRFKPSCEQPTVDCCVVTWNSLGLLKRTLESLTLVDYPADKIRVFVSNNGSTDGTAEYLAGLAGTYPFPITAINLPLNTGVAVGLNFAIQAGQGELVARLDDDIVLPRDWIPLMLQDLKQRPFAGKVGLKTLGDDDRRAIQWAGEAKHPKAFTHADESDFGQADVLTRVPHVAGCCVLYRRDAIRRCGPVDIRYSPTQVDDIDHSTALVAAGYEVLCEGRSHVLHKRTSGLDRSAAGVVSGNANYAKLEGKWGEDALQLLDNALVLSREGRSLPPDGDTSEWMNRGPAPEEFPRREVRLEAEPDQFVRRLYEAQTGPVSTGSELHQMADLYLSGVRLLATEGDLRGSADSALMMVNFAPTRTEGYRALAAGYRRLGQAGLARTAARRGLHLAPADPELLAAAAISNDEVRAGELAVIAHLRPTAQPLSAEAAAGWSVSAPLRVLLVKPFAPKPAHDDSARLEEYHRQLSSAGIYADVRGIPQPDPRGFDVVHLWGSSYPHQTIAQLKAVRSLAPHTPVVLTPQLTDTAGAKWTGQVLASIFSRPTRLQWEAGMNDFLGGKASANGEARPERSRFSLLMTETGYLHRHLFQQVDHLLPFSAAEAGEVEKLYGVTTPWTELPSGAGQEEGAAATAQAFVQQFKLRDFVLLTGPIDPARNQLMTLFALQAANLRVVIIGAATDASYAASCRKVAPRGSLFLDPLPRSLLLSAYKAARVFVDPVWTDASSASAVAAAFAGCSLALSDRINERASFAGGAQFFDPDRPVALRTAVQAAWSSHAARQADRETLAARLAARHDWSVVIPAAIGAYEALLARA